MIIDIPTPIFHTKHSDERGSFHEIYKENKKLNINFVQFNSSTSKKNVLRGLHFQLPPYEQDKLITVPYGKIFDVAVDIRINSKTYGESFSITLDSNEPMSFFIPKGFAHGFLVLSEVAVVNYYCSNIYNPNSESGLIWNDKDIGVRWPIYNVEKIIISEKDRNWKKLSELYK
jgi:dTDP-4-dehydrorhamnose 3,5-epimerase